MSDYFITEVSASDSNANEQIVTLLEAERIHKDKNLDYTCAMFDEDMQVIATGSCFSNTLRCLAVNSAHQGEGLMNQILTHLISVQFSRGNTHLFLYTKCNSAPFFANLGFYEIANIKNQIVFMENKRNGFSSYLKNLEQTSTIQNTKLLETTISKNNLLVKEKTTELSTTVSESVPKEKCILLTEGKNTEPTDALSKVSKTKTLTASNTTNLQKTIGSVKTAALVINANPFTLGHQYLVEKASRENDILHLFIVEEDASLIPFSIRKKLVLEGTSHLPNIIYHDSGPYIISNATFPGYFQKDDRAVMESHAELDLAVFVKIAETLHITKRYIGEEPFSETTGIYNKVMAEKLPKNGIDCIIVPREQYTCTENEKKNGTKNISSHSFPISASTVRQALKEGNFTLLKQLVPKTTLQYFESKEAIPVIKKIQTAKDVIHH